MPRTFKNLAASLLGSGGSALISLISIPLIIRFVGTEAYGLIGFYATLQGIFQLLDLGFSPTMSREMARYSVQPEKAHEARDLVRTLEVVYWVLAIIIGAVTVAFAPMLAGNWLQTQTIPVSVILQAIVIMGLLSAVQWPISFYQGGLIGLQHQVALQIGKTLFSALRNFGGVVVLALVSPTIITFFVWQVVVGAFQLIWLVWLMWRSMPKAEGHGSPKFRPALLGQVGGFAAGMSGIALFSTLLTQLDKVVLSRLLPLETFGYYIIATNLSGQLLLLASTVFNVAFPQFAALAIQNDLSALRDRYRLITQIMALLVIPIACTLIVFSRPILMAWTHNPAIAESVSPLLILLSIGTACNCLMVPAYSLKLASGFTRVAFAITATQAILLVPVILLLTNNYGVTGAASVWVILNTTYVLIGIPLTHHFVLKGEAGHWFKNALIIPLGCALAVVLAFRWVANALENSTGILAEPYTYLGLIVVVWSIAFLTCMIAMPLTQALMVQQKRKLIGVLR